MSSRLADIHELLNQVEVDLSVLEAEVEAAKGGNDIETLPRVLVKSCLEHLRSALDYAAHEVAEKYLGLNADEKKIYFPYGKTEEEFQKSLNRNLPGISEDLRTIIESLQPHRSGAEWLLELCEHTNFNKHRALTRQERKQSEPSTRVGNLIELGPNAKGRMTFGKLYVDGQLLNPNGPLQISNARSAEEIEADIQGLIKVRRTYGNIEFHFADSETSIVPLIRRAAADIRTLARRIEAALPTS
jgi:hypothetical protein